MKCCLKVSTRQSQCSISSYSRLSQCSSPAASSTWCFFITGFKSVSAAAAHPSPAASPAKKFIEAKAASPTSSISNLPTPAWASANPTTPSLLVNGRKPPKASSSQSSATTTDSNTPASSMHTDTSCDSEQGTRGMQHHFND